MQPKGYSLNQTEYTSNSPDEGGYMGRMDMHSANQCPKARVRNDLKAGRNGRGKLLDEYRPGEVFMSLVTFSVVSFFSQESL